MKPVLRLGSTTITNKSNELISNIVNIFEGFNQAVKTINLEINWSQNEQSKEINEIEVATKIIDYTNQMTAECKKIKSYLDEIPWEGIEELKETWNEHFESFLRKKVDNEKILKEISDNKTKILFSFMTFREFPAKKLLKLKDRNIAIIDELLRETIFETTKMVRMKKTFHFLPRPRMHKKIIEKLKIIREKLLEKKTLEEKEWLEEKLLEEKALEEKTLLEKKLKQDLPELVLLEFSLNSILKEDQKSIAIIDEHFKNG